MSDHEQSIFIKLCHQLLSQGYPLEATLELIECIYPKEVRSIKQGLNEGRLLSDIFQTLKFNRFVVEQIRFGLNSNQLTHAFSIVSRQFDFSLSMKKELKDLFVYPILLFFIGLIGFEFLRLRLYPAITGMMQSFDQETNTTLAFFAFHSLKGILLMTLLLLFFIRLNPKLPNVLPSVRQYRSLVFSQNLACLIEAGFSLEETFHHLSTSLNQRVYNVHGLEGHLIDGKALERLTSFDPGFLKLLSLGIASNRLFETIQDYQLIYQPLVRSTFKRMGQMIQMALFLIIASNIFMIYAVMMLPMFKMSGQI